ncbi:hypothetical protein P7K49_023061 [Saguinus oedipus]|uniref:Uncharacterized protein n=1 Tax=Saguinus oedipus TaxID=9490 RepID=A0ABQ9UKK4_SAGOE|nr:hypothetical protein P7K49_023061 [Saguinus oedipus]
MPSRARKEALESLSVAPAELADRGNLEVHGAEVQYIPKDTEPDSSQIPKEQLSDRSKEYGRHHNVYLTTGTALGTGLAWCMGNLPVIRHTSGLNP